MRIFHVITSLDPRTGGPANALSGLAKAQVRIGLPPIIFTNYREGETPFAAEDELRAAGVQVISAGPGSGPLLRHPRTTPELRQHVGAAAVVHIHSLWEDGSHVAAKTARELGVPYIIEPQGMLTPWSLGQKRLKKWLSMLWRTRKDLDCATALHYSSESERLASARLGLRPPAIVEPIGLTLDEFRHTPARGAFRARHPQIGNRPIIAFLGRIYPGKGLEYLVPALARIRGGNGADAVLIVAGHDYDNFKAGALSCQHTMLPSSNRPDGA